MKSKLIEVRKMQAMERIEAKLDLIAKSLGVDFGVLEEAIAEPAPEPEATPAEPSQEEETPTKSRKNK